MTEYYIVQDADAPGGGDGLSEVTAFTLAEWAARTPSAGDRGNIKTGTYSIGATSFTGGDSTGFVFLRGYNTTIGDLDSVFRSTDGSLDTTNMPDITVTGALMFGAYYALQNLDVYASISATIIDFADYGVMSRCRVENAQSSASAVCVNIGTGTLVADSDIVLSDATLSANNIIAANYSVIRGCKITRANASNAILVGYIVTAIGNYVSAGGANFYDPLFTTLNGTCLFDSNTFYNCGDIITHSSGDPNGLFMVLNNHATDSDRWIYSEREATADVAFVELNNRLRDITTLRTGAGDGVVVGEVDTDTGGPETDYTDYANGDLSLIDGASGVDAGLGFGSWNIGAQQDAREGSTTTGGVINDGLNGGFNG